MGTGKMGRGLGRGNTHSPKASGRVYPHNLTLQHFHEYLFKVKTLIIEIFDVKLACEVFSKFTGYCRCALPRAFDSTAVFKYLRRYNLSILLDQNKFDVTSIRYC